MTHNRIEDVILGVAMIAIGLSLPGLLLLGQLQPTDLTAGFGITSTRFVGFVVFLMSLFGLFLAVMGVLTIRDGRSTSDTAGLY